MRLLGRLVTFIDPDYRGDSAITAPKHCAYNQTSECFLGLEVDAADFSPALLNDRIPSLTPESGAGLWITPFRGISPGQVRMPLDLVYLDENCRVIDVVESFPLSRISSTRQPAASVLALPVHSIQLSQTKPGDQLVLCAARDLADRLSRVEIHRGSQNRLERVETAEERSPSGHAIFSPQLESWREQPETAPREIAAPPAPPEKKKAKNWLERFLAPKPLDPRRAPRKVVPGVFAFYWTGATPLPHSIKNISDSGLYIVTEERWYPETVVRLMLTKTDSRGINRSLSIQARVVRWGNDGVGLQFITLEARNQGVPAEAEGATRAQLDEFLQWIGKGAD